MEAWRAAKAEEAIAKGYGVDASDLIQQHGTVTYFWDGTFTHDQMTIHACLPSLG